MNILHKILLSALCFSFLPAGLILAYQNPIVSAGPDLYLTSGQAATLQGSGYDPNGFALNYYWTCNGGNLSSYNIAQPVYTAPYAINGNNQVAYDCTLTVTNNYGNSASDGTTVYVNYNNNNYNYNLSIQTNSATNNYAGQATLNGNISGNGAYGTAYVWFQWGTTTSYGYESNHRAIGNIGAFDQHIADLLPNTTYYFRAVAQQNNGNLIYGQDLIFNTPGYGTVSNPPTPPIFYNNGGRVLGASIVSTGLANNFLTDSFFLPLLLILLGSWMYFSGKIYSFADWLKLKIQ